jgi:hypothetical protein
MMSFRPLFAGALMLAAAQGSAHAAATLTTDYNTWVAGAAGYLSTTTDPNYNGTSTTSSIGTTAGGTLTTNPGSDAILTTFTDWGPWTAANGTAYHGIVYATNFVQSETITLPSMFTAFSLEIQPDANFNSPGFPEIITVTLSDGQSTQISTTFNTIGQTAFVGYYGGRETSMTISVANAPDFAFGDFRIVPEPASMLVFATGLTVMGMVRRHR